MKDFFLSTLAAFCLAAFSTVMAQEMPAVGDYFYEDGTWSTEYSDAKKCVGIVFATGAQGGDKVGNYGKTFAGKTIKGYVMALENVRAYGKGAFYTSEEVQKFPAAEKVDWKQYDGYKQTRSMNRSEEFKNNRNGYQCLKNFNRWSKANPAPANTSGWYIPSAAQLWDFMSGCAGTELNEALSKSYNAHAKAFTIDNKPYFYFSSDMNPNSMPAGAATNKDGTITKKGGLKPASKGLMRAVLTIIE